MSTARLDLPRLEARPTMISRSYLATSRRSFLLTVPIVCLFIALRLWHLTSYGFWFDEVFSHRAARLGWGELISFVVSDVVHPPLFYLLLKLWIEVGGESLLWLKLFPVVTSIAMLAAFFLLCKELKLKTAEINTALFLVAVNCFLIHYAQEVRMYSLLTFFTLLSLWLFVRLVNTAGSSSRILAGLFIVNLFLVYTHYFGWLIVGTEGCYLLLRNRRHLLRFSITVTALVLCFLPWTYLLFHAAIGQQKLGGNIAWITRPHLADLIWYFAVLHGSFDIPRTTLPGLILFGLPLLYWTWLILKGEQGSSAPILWVLAFFALLPVIFTFLVSNLLSQSIWSERYLIVAALPYLLLIAIAVHQLRPTWVRTSVLALAICWAALSSIYGLSRHNNRFDWMTLTRQIIQVESGAVGNVKVYAFERFVSSPIESSLNFMGAPAVEVAKIDNVTALQGAHFWVAYRAANWEPNLPPQVSLRNRGCQIGEEVFVSKNGDKEMGEGVTLFPVWCQP